VRRNGRGQVTIPANLRERHGLHEGDELDVVDVVDTLRIARVPGSTSCGERLVGRIRGRATTTMSTDQLLGLLRGE
jgi:AbrB family looped-hinge helix DNA binding protein